MLPYQSSQLDIGDNYTKTQVGVPPTEINVGVYLPTKYDSVLIFSTIFNGNCWVNYKMNDTHFVYASRDTNIFKGQKENLLFIRKDQSSGFYYFGPCKFVGEIDVENYFAKACIFELINNSFSQVTKMLLPQQQDDLKQIGLL